jgi:protein-disulfide isomerase-like protein with CxxC motif
MADVEMNKGVQILLERMSSNPDEFTPDLRNGYPPKWRNIILSVEMRTKGGKDYQDQLPFLSDKEIKALWQKMQELQGELFTKQVMNTLLRDAEDGLGYSEVIELIEAKAKQAELSSLSRQVTGGSPKGKI